MTRRIPALALLLALLLSGCATRPVEKTVFAMDTVMTLRIWGSEAAASAAAERLYQLDAALSVTREDSEIAALNRQGSAELSPEYGGAAAAVAGLLRADGGRAGPHHRACGRVLGLHDGGLPPPRCG